MADLGDLAGKADVAGVAGSPAGRRRVVVVLDDDPTGTQASAGLTIQLDPHADPAPLLASSDALHILTNTRSLPEAEAVRLVAGIRDRVERAATALDVDVEYVLRGDSTLRGHVLAESDVFGAAEDVLLFVPAYPEAGRTTEGGVHYVRVDGKRLVAADTEFAADPVFGYAGRTMAEWVRELGGEDRPARTVPLRALRSAPDGSALADELVQAPPGGVVIPDIAALEDLAVASRGLRLARERGRSVVARGSAPFAALLTGKLAGTYPRPEAAPGNLLVVCGSHTAASTAQLHELAQELGTPVRTISTTSALAAAEPEGERVAALAVGDLDRRGIAVIASERDRRPEHGELAHGAAVMRALCTAVRRLADRLDTVVAKGGITAAEVARSGLGVRTARVRGPLATGVAWWRLAPEPRPESPREQPERPEQPERLDYVVVPGNVGGPRTLVDVTAPWRTRTVSRHGR